MEAVGQAAGQGTCGDMRGKGVGRGGRRRGRPRCCFVQQGRSEAAPTPLPTPSFITLQLTLLITGGRGLAACQQLIACLPGTLTWSPDPQDDGWLIALTLALIGSLLHPRILIVQGLHPKMLIAHW